MFKISHQDLEKILKSLKLAEHSIKKTSSVSNSTKMSIIDSIKLIENDYLNIKPKYNI